MAVSADEREAQKAYFTEKGRGEKVAALVKLLRYRDRRTGRVTTAQELMDWPGHRWQQLADDAAVKTPSIDTRQRVIDALSPTPYEVELHERNTYRP